MGVFEKDMLLQEMLYSISFVLPDVKIVYNKEFTTPEGVLIARIDITDIEGNPYPLYHHERIKRVMRRLHSKARSKSGRVIETTGGFEHYLRVIIPHLVKEFKISGSSQVFFSIMDTSEFCIEFKIIVVSDKKDKVKKVTKILKGFDRVDGLSMLSTHPPKIYGNVIVYIFDVRGDLDKYESSSELYDETKEIIKRAVGEFRDFDEGLRKTDIFKLQSVLEILPYLPEKEVKLIYYTLEDFWRMSASIADIAKVIELTYNIILRYKKGEIISDYTELKGGTAIVIATPKEKTLVGKVSNAFKNCEITLSRIERPMATILLAYVSSNEKPLPEERVLRILSKIIP